MDSCCATLKGKVFPGGGIKSNIEGNAFWGQKVHYVNKIRKKKQIAERSKAGVAYSVLTRDINKELVELESAPFLEEKPRADPKNVASIIFGGGAGTRLFPLTSRRAKPAVPIGGCYWLIDVPMSNCINSGIRKIFILTQFNSFSLNRHLARTYNFGNGLNFGDGFVVVRRVIQ